ncbi:MAG: OmpA family protein [Bacteroidia bacterium]
MPFRTLFCGFILSLLSFTHVFSQEQSLNAIPHSIRVFEEVSLKPIVRAVARVYEGDSIVGQFLTDSMGIFRMQMLPYRLWRIEMVSKDHYSKEVEFDTRNLADIKLVTTIALVPKSYYQFKGVLLDEDLEYFLPGVDVKLQDRTSRRTYYNTSNERGVFFFPLIPGHDYDLWADDDSFFRAKATMLDCSDQIKGEDGIGVFCTSGFTLQDYKLDSKTGQKTLVGTMRLQKLELNRSYQLRDIYYDYGRSSIRSDAAKVLNRLYILLEQNPQVEIELSSHTDSRGKADGNMRLSKARAESAKAYLVKKGIHKDRIRAVGYGETKLKNTCKNGVECTEKQHEENRRTEFQVIGIQFEQPPKE